MRVRHPSAVVAPIATGSDGEDTPGTVDDRCDRLVNRLQAIPALQAGCATLRFAVYALGADPRHAFTPSLGGQARDLAV